MGFAREYKRQLKSQMKGKQFPGKSCFREGEDICGGIRSILEEPLFQPREPGWIWEAEAAMKVRELVVVNR